MKICVIGLGYIGLPLAALIASKGFNVLGVDIEKNIVQSVNQGKSHFYEDNLNAILEDVVKSKKLVAKNEIEESDIFVITVPTPLNMSQGKYSREPDTSYVEEAIKSISKVLKKSDLIIIESTCPVGTTQKLVSILDELRTDLIFSDSKNREADVGIAYCPERILPGNTLHELVNNDRIIGGYTKKSATLASDFYKTFILGKCSTTNARTAELAKLSENAFRDVNIAFANELSIICDELNINVYELINLSNLHPRVNILKPGSGVGGHCIAIDPWFIVASSKSNSKLIRTAREVNIRKTEWVFEQTKKEIDKLLKVKKDQIIIGIYGLTYKPNSDDIRESPSLKIIDLLLNLQVKILVTDNNISKVSKSLEKKISLCSYDETAKKADIHLLLTAHSYFMDRTPLDGVILDFTGLWSKQH